MSGDGLYRCPLCPWTMPKPERAPESTAIALALGMPAGALADIGLHQDHERAERDLDKHLRTHGPQEWLPALMAARATADNMHRMLQSMTEFPRTPTVRVGGGEP